MENETDVIREQMLETRTALTEKLEALQDTVVTAVQGTTESVTETVQNVKEAVQDTVSNVTESVQETVQSVKSTLDIGAHVQNHPWAMFGGAVALGYLGGRLIPSASTVAHAATSAATSAASAATGAMGAAASNLTSSPSSGYGASSYGASSHGAPSGGAYQPSASSSSNGPTWVDSLTEAARPAIKQLEGMAIGTLMGVLGELAVGAAPEGFKPQLKDMLEKLNTTLGGERVDCSGLLDSFQSLANPSSSTPSSSHQASSASNATSTSSSASPSPHSRYGQSYQG